MRRTVDEQLTAYVGFLEMPASIRDDVSNARADLYHGPLYLDDDGEQVSCFDEGAKAFDFSAACQRIADWCESKGVDGLWVDTFAGNWQTSEPEPYDDGSGEVDEVNWSDWYHAELSEVIAAITGKALAEYVA